MLKFNFKLIFCLLILVQIVPSYKTQEVQDKNDDIDDYSWDYDENSDVKPPLTKKEIISLNRDWLGRDDPDKYPSNGFYPVWVVCLLVMSAFFHVLAVIFGLLHVLGCKGRRPVEVKPVEIKRRISSVDVKKQLSRQQSIAVENQK